MADTAPALRPDTIAARAKREKENPNIAIISANPFKGPDRTNSGATSRASDCFPFEFVSSRRKTKGRKRGGGGEKELTDFILACDIKLCPIMNGH